MALILDGTEGITQPSITTAFGVPAGTTAQRPSVSEVGMIRFNTDLNALENFTADGWFPVSVPIPTLTSVSGDITNGAASVLTLTGTNFGIGAGTVRFTSGATVANVAVTPASQTSATVTVPSAIFNLSASTVVGIQFVNEDNGVSNSINKTVAIPPLVTDFLVIAGGGGGAGNGAASIGGAGGAGGYRELTAQALNPATNYTVTVGAGGAGGVGNVSAGASGSNSVFNSTTSAGGGGGANQFGAAGSGGSGGGGGGNVNTGSGSGNTPSTSPSQGNNGGSGSGGSPFGGGGGGGASAVGANGGGTGGNGGNGSASSITGASVTRAGGGGGGVNNTNAAGTGGSGGGGNGANETGTAQAGTVNTGGGGGGVGQRAGAANGGAGGSGVVIVKYPAAYTITNPGGGLTSSTASAGGFKVTTFTAGTGNIQFN